MLDEYEDKEKDEMKRKAGSRIHLLLLFAFSTFALVLYSSSGLTWKIKRKMRWKEKKKPNFIYFSQLPLNANKNLIEFASRDKIWTAKKHARYYPYLSYFSNIIASVFSTYIFFLYHFLYDIHMDDAWIKSSN